MITDRTNPIIKEYFKRLVVSIFSCSPRVLGLVMINFAFVFMSIIIPRRKQAPMRIPSLARERTIRFHTPFRLIDEKPKEEELSPGEYLPPKDSWYLSAKVSTSCNFFDEYDIRPQLL